MNCINLPKFCISCSSTFWRYNTLKVCAKMYSPENGTSQLTMVLFHNVWDKKRITEFAVRWCIYNPPIWTCCSLVYSFDEVSGYFWWRSRGGGNKLVFLKGQICLFGEIQMFWIIFLQVDAKLWALNKYFNLWFRFE